MLTIDSVKEPYYCIINHSGQEQVIDSAKKIIAQQKYQFIKGNDHFQHCRLSQEDCLEIIKLTPLALLTPICSRPYASIFSTGPGHYYRAHKDGLSIKFALNYILEVNDNSCVTSWYNDGVEQYHKSTTLNGSSRELIDFDNTQHQPDCSVIFEKNQCVLFNTDIYHDFDNRRSRYDRKVLTIRYTLPIEFNWAMALLEIQKHAS